MSTVDKYKVGDLVKYRVSRCKNVALVIEKAPEMKQYLVKWCHTGQAIWVWGYVLVPAY